MKTCKGKICKGNVILMSQNRCKECHIFVKENATEIAQEWCEKSGVMSPDGTYFDSLVYCIEKGINNILK